MRRRIAVIIAALAMAWPGSLAAQAPDSGKKVPGGATPAPAAPWPQTAPVPYVPPRAAPTPAPAPRAAPAAPVQRAAPAPAAPAPRAVPVQSTNRCDLPASVARPPNVSPDDIAKALEDSIRALGLQTDLGTPEVDKPQTTRISPIRIPQEALWLALILAVALLLYALRDELMNLVRRTDTGWEAPAAGAGEVKIGSETDALAAADRLSREGNFVEAMHVLLLHSLAEIRRQLGEKFDDSLTSREIVRIARLTVAARGALREIVAAVERTYFGPYPAAAGDYAACRQNFETLAQALRGGAPA
jgi:hypothetical protein